MLLSTSAQDIKKTRKKYHKFKANTEKNNFATTESANINDDLKKEVSEKKTYNKPDWKDFPELKASEKLDCKLNFDSSDVGLKKGKPWRSVVISEREQNSNEAFPALSRTRNFKKCVGENSKEAPKLPEKEISVLKMESDIEIKKEKSTDVDDNKKSKVSSPKKDVIQPKKNPNKKKRTDPVLINFQSIITVNKKQRKTRQSNILRSKIQIRREKEFLSGNILDSSNPKRNKGKHREIKKLKLTNLKKIIIKERILKHKIRELKVTDLKSENESFSFINNIDFRSEMKCYLNTLSENRKKKSEDKKLKEEKISKQDQKIVQTELVEKKNENENVKDVVSLCKDKQIPQVTLEGEIKFSSKFREYCDNIITPALNNAVTDLIKELIKFQDRQFSKDPIKAKARKRHVSGIKEVRKYLKLKKAKMIIIAPNLEKLQMEGSVFDTIDELKSIADSQNVVYGFALDRYKLGKCTRKNVPVSAFAVLNYEGVENFYKNVLDQLLEAKKKFFDLNMLTASQNTEKTEDVNAKLISTLIAAFRKEVCVTEKGQSETE